MLLPPLLGQHLALEHPGHPLPPELLLDFVYVPQPLCEAGVEVKSGLRDLMRLTNQFLSNYLHN